MPDLPDELIRTNAILGEYVTIHDAIFKFSWRKALSSIPGLFKATDFGAHVRELDRLASNLEEISTALKADPEALEGSHHITVTPDAEPPTPVTVQSKAAPLTAEVDNTTAKKLLAVVDSDRAFSPVSLLSEQNLQQAATRTEGFAETPSLRNSGAGAAQSLGLVIAPAANLAAFNLQALTASEGSASGRIASATSSPAFTRELDRAREGNKAAEELERNIIVSSVTAGAGMSVGYVFWLLRGGLLLTSLLSSLPAWRFVDPLPILGRLNDDEEDGYDGDGDGESLESIVGGEDTPAPDSPNASTSTKDQHNV